MHIQYIWYTVRLWWQFYRSGWRWRQPHQKFGMQLGAVSHNSQWEQQARKHHQSDAAYSTKQRSLQPWPDEMIMVLPDVYFLLKSCLITPLYVRSHVFCVDCKTVTQNSRCVVQRSGCRVSLVYFRRIRNSKISLNCSVYGLSGFFYLQVASVTLFKDCSLHFRWCHFDFNSHARLQLLHRLKTFSSFLHQLFSSSSEYDRFKRLRVLPCLNQLSLAVEHLC